MSPPPDYHHLIQHAQRHVRTQPQSPSGQYGGRAARHRLGCPVFTGSARSTPDPQQQAARFPENRITTSSATASPTTAATAKTPYTRSATTATPSSAACRWKPATTSTSASTNSNSAAYSIAKSCPKAGTPRSSASAPTSTCANPTAPNNTAPSSNTSCITSTRKAR